MLRTVKWAAGGLSSCFYVQQRTFSGNQQKGLARCNLNKGFVRLWPGSAANGIKSPLYSPCMVPIPEQPELVVLVRIEEVSSLAVIPESFSDDLTINITVASRSPHT